MTISIAILFFSPKNTTNGKKNEINTKENEDRDMVSDCVRSMIDMVILNAVRHYINIKKKLLCFDISKVRFYTSMRGESSIIKTLVKGLSVPKKKF